MNEYPLHHPQQLAPILRALRKHAGLSQADLAARLGVTHQAISALERRPEAATLERLMRVLAVLKVDVVLSPRKPAKVSEPGAW